MVRGKLESALRPFVSGGVNMVLFEVCTPDWILTSMAYIFFVPPLSSSLDGFVVKRRRAPTFCEFIGGYIPYMVVDGSCVGPWIDLRPVRVPTCLAASWPSFALLPTLSQGRSFGTTIVSSAVDASTTVRTIAAGVGEV